MELTEAVREIPDDGAEIALGGFAITRNPIAFVNEIIRQKKKNLTFVGYYQGEPSKEENELLEKKIDSDYQYI